MIRGNLELVRRGQKVLQMRDDYEWKWCLCGEPAFLYSPLKNEEKVFQCRVCYEKE
ncbi:hypothetical protein QJ529_18755 [Bacillus paranthracis]|uniref:hypothetical protein n=1 Tax=Bacillus TaxID=1386 RepID=UPI0015E0C028|nr:MULTISPECIES: hypothetical protein [Bacillus]MDO3374709.1 hypothetical protein [Bacillus paranthracis]